MLKNMDKAKVLKLKDEVEYQQGQVVSKTLAQNNFVSVTLFSFWKGRKSVLMNPVEMPLLPAWMVLARLPLTVWSMS